jgi:hypothetical protein
MKIIKGDLLGDWELRDFSRNCCKSGKIIVSIISIQFLCKESFANISSVTQSEHTNSYVKIFWLLADVNPTKFQTLNDVGCKIWLIPLQVGV